jgi:lysophospholipase L1-like esterase
MSLALKVALSPLLVAEAVYARATLPRLPEPGGEREGAVGRGPLLRLLVAGDSSAAGVGVESQELAFAAPLARLLAQGCRARVAWRLMARSGLTTAQTLDMLRDEQAPMADVAVVVTGVNDVVDQVPSMRAVAAREAIANWLRNSRGVAHVAFAPLPPVHQFAGLPQPLRWVAGADAERHNRALREWATTRADVSCVEVHVPLSRDNLASDGFHPGEPVYRHCVEAIALHIQRHVWPQIDERQSR